YKRLSAGRLPARPIALDQPAHASYPGRTAPPPNTAAPTAAVVPPPTPAVIAATAIIGAAAIRSATGVAGIRTAAVIGAAAAAATVAVIIVDNGFAEARRHAAHTAIEAVGIAVSEHRRDTLKEQRATGDPGRRGRGRAQEPAAASAAEHADTGRGARLRIAGLLGIARLRVLRRALLRGRWRDIGTAAPRPGIGPAACGLRRLPAAQQPAEKARRLGLRGIGVRQ